MLISKGVDSILDNTVIYSTTPPVCTNEWMLCYKQMKILVKYSCGNQNDVFIGEQAIVHLYVVIFL